MCDLVPEELWREQILPSLVVCDVIALRATSSAKAALITGGLLLQRIDTYLARHELSGTVDVNRNASAVAGDIDQPSGFVAVVRHSLLACARRLTGRRLTHFGYLVRCLYVLEQGGSEWRLMGMVVRLAAIYRLTPNGLPLALSVAQLHSKSAFDSVPLAMAIYRLIGHQLTLRGQRLALRRAANGEYRIGDRSFRVVPFGDLPADHPYRSTYNESDPVVRWGRDLFPSFTAFLTMRPLMWWWPYEAGVVRVVFKAVLWVHKDRSNPGFQRLLTAGDIPEQLGYTADNRFDRGNLSTADPIDRRYVIVSGFRPTDTVAAFMRVDRGGSGCGRPSRLLPVCLPPSMSASPCRCRCGAVY
ncbi:unnamed protein product [Vitrella brassicaformis CCMP3155]|uniref:Uncharacterized protein n=1 Tax=Vitrella brassicaformis (strain CCMP3155) TaxID=1169540 RepID=A0A0G4GER1_VITBC|nr:unnamed protein product [Vitrella brassicaformis CCMP3155]|eukprot:CEM27667.1 unnamed protein product [Vitrella brassicaformis CCMP3155]